VWINVVSMLVWLCDLLSIAWFVMLNSEWEVEFFAADIKNDFDFYNSCARVYNAFVLERKFDFSKFNLFISSLNLFSSWFFN
jgi:hypothetical protein